MFFLLQLAYFTNTLLAHKYFAKKHQLKFTHNNMSFKYSLHKFSLPICETHDSHLNSSAQMTSMCELRCQVVLLTDLCP